jgi:hypothetical protein
MLIGTITSHINYYFFNQTRRSPFYSYARPFIVSGEPSIPSIVVENKNHYSIGTMVLIQNGSDGYEATLSLSAVTDASGNPITEGNASSLNVGTVTGDLDVCGSLAVGVSAIVNGNATFASSINVGGSAVVSGNATFVSSINVSGAAVVDGNATFGRTINVSGDVNGMPYPPPYAHIRMNAPGVNSDDQYNFASSCGNMYTTSSKSSHFNWNNTDKELDVSGAGEYEVNLTAAAQTDTTNNQVTCRVKLDGVIQTAITYRINTATDPHPISISWIGPVTSGQSITVTIDGTYNTQLMLGSAITVKRVS